MFTFRVRWPLTVGFLTRTNVHHHLCQVVSVIECLFGYLGTEELQDRLKNTSNMLHYRFLLAFFVIVFSSNNHLTNVIPLYSFLLGFLCAPTPTQNVAFCAKTLPNLNHSISRSENMHLLYLKLQLIGGFLDTKEQKNLKTYILQTYCLRSWLWSSTLTAALACWSPD